MSETNSTTQEVVDNLIENIVDGPNSSVIAGNTTDNVASGLYSFAANNDTSATGAGAFAEGHGSEANGVASHGESAGAANGDYSHAENTGTTGVNALYAHAENAGVANGKYSHSQGNGTADGDYSSAGGLGTVASHDNQTVVGKYNALDGNNESTDGAFIIGGGTSHADRLDVFSVDWNGNVNTRGNYCINGVPIGSGGSGGLPEVTTADNGKFLRVVNGTWAAASVSQAGGNIF